VKKKFTINNNYNEHILLHCCLVEVYDVRTRHVIKIHQWKKEGSKNLFPAQVVREREEMKESSIFSDTFPGPEMWVYLIPQDRG
jgi:hypothetical protein